MTDAAGRVAPDRALRWSLAGHGLLLLLVLFGGLSLPRSPPPTELAIRATVVDPKAAGRAAKPPPKTAPKPESKPEPKPEPEPRPEPRPDPALEQRRAQQEREQKEELVQREKALKEQQRAEEVKARKATEQRQQEAKLAEKKAAADRLQAEKRQAEKLKEEKLKAEKLKAEKLKEEKLQAEKLKAERQKTEAAEREIARQLEDEERLLAATESGALADYLGLISQRVTRNWIRPANAGAGLECVVVVTQIPGGEVVGVQVERCNGDDAVRRSIEAAVLKSSPLPMPADDALFDRSLRFTFKPEQ